jgi:hypothetical protein
VPQWLFSGIQGTLHQSVSGITAEGWIPLGHRIRPMFLQSEERIKSLILVNILALLVYSLLEWICQRNKLATSGRDALDIFRLPTIVTLTFQGQTIQQIGNVSGQAMQVMEVLKLGPPDPV